MFKQKLNKYSVLIMACMFSSQQFKAQQQTVVYCHGIVDNASQSARFAQAFPADSKVVPLNFADSVKPTGYNFNAFIGYCAGMAGKIVNRAKMFMGQADDLITIDQTLSQCDSNNSVVAYGCSRGGAAWVTYLGQYNPANIKALVLDACPANMPSTLDPQLAQCGIPLRFDTAVFQTLFPAYPSNAISPLQAIKTIKNKNLPILLVHSKTDQRVSWINSLKLYQEFKNNGFTNVHVCIVPSGRHSFMLQDADSAPDYLRAAHSFYQRYNIAHNPNYVALNPFTIISDSQISQILQTYQKDLEAVQEKAADNLWYYTKVAGATVLALAVMKASLLKNK